MATEFDYTSAVEAAAEVWWGDHGNAVFVSGDGEESPVTWAQVPPMVKNQIRYVLLDAVVAAVDVALEQQKFSDMMDKEFGNGEQD